jgi:hypothetical protein
MLKWVANYMDDYLLTTETYDLKLANLLVGF